MADAVLFGAILASFRRHVVSSSRRFGVSMGRGGGVVLAVKTRR